MARPERRIVLVNRHHRDGLNMASGGQLFLKYLVRIRREENTLDRRLVADAHGQDTHRFHGRRDSSVLYGLAGLRQLKESFRLAFLILNKLKREIAIQALVGCGGRRTPDSPGLSTPLTRCGWTSRRCCPSIFSAS